MGTLSSTSEFDTDDEINSDKLDKLQQLIIFCGAIRLDQLSFKLPELRFLDVGSMEIFPAVGFHFNIETHDSPFNVIDLPALRQLTLRSKDLIRYTSVRRLFDPLIPRLSRLTLDGAGVFEESIKSIRNSQPPISLEILIIKLEELEDMTDSLMDNLILCDFRQLRLVHGRAGNDWTMQLNRLETLLDKNKFIKEIHVQANYIDESTPFWSLRQKWNQFKQQLRALCAVKHIAVIELSCIVTDVQRGILWAG